MGRSGKSLSLRELGKHLGVSAVQISRLRDLGMPMDLDGARRWRAERAQTVAQQRSMGLEEQRRRKTAAEADLAEMAAAKMRGELVSAEDVVESWEAVCDRLRSRLLAVPGRYAPRLKLPMAEATALLDGVVGEVIDEIRADAGAARTA